MTETLLLRMPETDQIASWLVVDAFGNPMGQCQTGTLIDAVPFAAGRRLRVCVPGSAVMQLIADIPSSNTQKIQQAIPFALEDKLAEDVDLLHFAVGVRDARGYSVAVVSRVRMQKWLDELSAVGLTPAELIPDTLAVPLHEHTLVVVPDDRNILVRFPDGTGMTAETSLMPLMIKRHLSSMSAEKCTHVLVYSSEESLTPELHDMLKAQQLEISYRPLNGNPIALMTSTVRDTHSINLLQGMFGQRSGTMDHWRRWRMVAALSLALSVVFAAQQAVSEYRLRHEAKILDAQVQSLFHTAVPDMKNVTDSGVMEKVMQQRVGLLTGNSANSVGLLPMLAAVGDVMQSEKGVRLESFSYHDNNLQLQISADSIDTLNGMKTTLAGNSALHVEMDSLNSSSGTTTGRLTISSGHE
ncbi:MAG TPA: type II secretion system protein GspL [Gammaproteobacteria bacterium]|nr:type II secretion system protein GspL [Gammaproteobacteria bacterium]